MYQMCLKIINIKSQNNKDDESKNNYYKVVVYHKQSEKLNCCA